MSEFVSTEHPRPGVLLVRLDRPDALNTMNAGLVQELHDTIAAVREDSAVRAIVLTGEGRAFCAGLDLKGYGEPPGTADGEGRVQLGMRVQEHIAGLPLAFRDTRAPIIAAVNGPAYGGGMSLALAADIRLMSTGGAFQASFVKRGQSACDIGLSYLLPRIVGFSRATEIMLTGRRVGAEEALEIGLASSVHPEDELLDAALGKAEEIAENAPFGVWMTKDVLWSNLEAGGLHGAMALENRTQILAAMTKDHRESVRAFLEKRPPVYRNH
ncbi:enoyl-CoA hydratase/isomerase family protein [Actinomadura sp. LOL_016]|uniref:enoyl-CoA hydratase/isomerase family protein n=1 Tax=unclassified Actinomadura TaxID=2626254 RepID=UPI003A80D1EB